MTCALSFRLWLLTTRILTAVAMFGAVTAEATSIPAFDLDRADGAVGGKTPSDMRTLGFVFELNETVTVTHLGVFNYDADGFATPARAPGLTNPHRVALWDFDGTPIEEAAIPAGTSALAVDFFLYVPIDPIVLRAGQRYVLGSRSDDDQNPDDFYIMTAGATGRFSSAAQVKWIEERQTAASVWGFPEESPYFFPNGYFGPNFLFEPIPEPGSALLLGIGLMGRALMRQRL